MCTRVYICRIFVCLSRVSVVFAFFLLARLYGYMAVWLYALGSTFDVKLRSCLLFTLYVCTIRPKPSFPDPCPPPTYRWEKRKARGCEQVASKVFALYYDN